MDSLLDQGLRKMLEIISTGRFVLDLQQQGYAAGVDEGLIHILASAMFSGMLEVTGHDMHKQKSVEYIRQLRAFTPPDGIKY